MSEFSDGFTDYGRNCACGSGVYVLVDEFHGKCGVCGATKLTQLGLNELHKEERIKMGIVKEDG
jgi:hypothetical protein